MALASAVLRSSAQNGIGRREQPVLSNLFLITNQNKCYLLFLIWAHKKKQTVAPSVRGTATTTKQPLLLLLRFLIIQSTFPYWSLLERLAISQIQKKVLISSIPWPILLLSRSMEIFFWNEFHQISPLDVVFCQQSQIKGNMRNFYDNLAENTALYGEVLLFRL